MAKLTSERLDAGEGAEDLYGLPEEGCGVERPGHDLESVGVEFHGIEQSRDQLVHAAYGEPDVPGAFDSGRSLPPHQEKLRIDRQGIEKTSQVMTEYRNHPVAFLHDLLSGLVRRDPVSEENGPVVRPTALVPASTTSRATSPGRLPLLLAGRTQGWWRDEMEPSGTPVTSLG